MKKFLFVLSYILVAAAAVVVTLAVAQPRSSATMSKLDQLSLLIQTVFIEEPDVKAMGVAAAEALVDSLGDQWSHYMSAKEFGVLPIKHCIVK